MGAIIVPFETRTQRDERLHLECLAAYHAHVSVETAVTYEALVQALDRFVVFQRRCSRSKRPDASQGDSVCLLVRRPTGKRN